MHWTDTYVGMEYIPREQDCAQLVQLVNREVFDRELPIPSERETHFIRQTLQINQAIEKLVEEIDLTQAKDGDVVLMISRGRLSHTGVFARIHGTDYVLHNLKSHGCVLLHKISALEKFGLKFEGVYRFNDAECLSP